LLSNELPNPGNDEAGGVDISGSNAGERLPGSKAASPAPLRCHCCGKQLPWRTSAVYIGNQSGRHVFHVLCPSCKESSTYRFMEV